MLQSHEIALELVKISADLTIEAMKHSHPIVEQEEQDSMINVFDEYFDRVLSKYEFAAGTKLNGGFTTIAETVY